MKEAYFFGFCVFAIYTEIVSAQAGGRNSAIQAGNHDPGAYNSIQARLLQFRTPTDQRNQFTLVARAGSPTSGPSYSSNSWRPSAANSSPLRPETSITVSHGNGGPLTVHANTNSGGFGGGNTRVRVRVQHFRGTNKRGRPHSVQNGRNVNRFANSYRQTPNRNWAPRDTQINQVYRNSPRNGSPYNIGSASLNTLRQQEQPRYPINGRGTNGVSPYDTMPNSASGYIPDYSNTAQVGTSSYNGAHVPQFSKNHLRAPSNVIHDSIRNRVNKWMKNSAQLMNVDRHPKANNGTGLSNPGISSQNRPQKSDVSHLSQQAAESKSQTPANALESMHQKHGKETTSNQKFLDAATNTGLEHQKSTQISPRDQYAIQNAEISQGILSTSTKPSTSVMSDFFFHIPGSNPIKLRVPQGTKISQSHRHDGTSKVILQAQSKPEIKSKAPLIPASTPIVTTEEPPEIEAP